MTRLAALACAAVLVPLGACLPTVDPAPDRVVVPPGYRIDVLTDALDDARGLALGANGTLFVGTHGAGKVYAVTPGAAGTPARVRVIAEGLYHPHGVAFRDGALYVAETSRVLRYADIERQLDSPPEPEVVLDGLPRYLHHGLRPIRFGPDGRLYMALGAPCNVCLPEADRFMMIAAFDLESRSREIIATGVRNSVGFDFAPAGGALWFTDNGRDLLGNDIPGDELNVVGTPGDHFGYPYCHAGTIEDPEFGGATACADFVPPARVLGPHVAALGMTFYTGESFPAALRGSVLIAEHGSWNRDPSCGYRLAVVTPETRDYRVLVDWLDGDDVRGRPVDVVVAPDGSVYVSDDGARVIWHLRYEGPPDASPELPEATCRPAGAPSFMQKLFQRFGQ